MAGRFSLRMNDVRSLKLSSSHIGVDFQKRNKKGLFIFLKSEYLAGNLAEKKIRKEIRE
jgi:hypothetical protein